MVGCMLEYSLSMFAPTIAPNYGSVISDIIDYIIAYAFVPICACAIHDNGYFAVVYAVFLSSIAGLNICSFGYTIAPCVDAYTIYNSNCFDLVFTSTLAVTVLAVLKMGCEFVNVFMNVICHDCDFASNTTN